MYDWCLPETAQWSEQPSRQTLASNLAEREVDERSETAKSCLSDRCVFADVQRQVAKSFQFDERSVVDRTQRVAIEIEAVQTDEADECCLVDDVDRIVLEFEPDEPRQPRERSRMNLVDEVIRQVKSGQSRQGREGRWRHGGQLVVVDAVVSLTARWSVGCQRVAVLAVERVRRRRQRRVA